MAKKPNIRDLLTLEQQEELKKLNDQIIEGPSKTALELEELYNQYPQNQEILELLASQSYNGQLWEKAIKYNKLYQSYLDEPSEEIEIRIATSYMRLEDYPKAITHFNRAIGIDDDDHYLYQSRAECYFRNGEFIKGFKDLNTCMIESDDDVENDMYILKNVPFEKISILDEIIQKNEGNANFHLMRTFLLDEHEKFEESAQYSITLLKHDYEQIDFIYNLASRYFLWEMYDESLLYYNALYNSGILKKDDDLFCTFRIGLIKYKQNDFNSAIKYFTKSASEYPLGYVYRAVCNLKRGKTKKLIDDLIQASSKIYLSEFSASHHETPFYLEELGKIILQDTTKRMVEILTALFDLDKKLSEDRLLKNYFVLVTNDYLKEENYKADISAFKPVFKFYPGSHENYWAAQKADSADIFSLGVKLSIVRYLSEKHISILPDTVVHRQYDTPNKRKNIYRSDKIPTTDFLKMRNLFYFQNLLNEELIKLRSEHFVEAEIQKEKDIARAQLNERNKVIADLSHSIKNLISSVIDPLQNMANESGETPLISNALRGANLVRQVVNAMNLSYKGSLADFLYDAQNPGTESATLKRIVTNSLVYSVNNVFDGKYFNQFNRAYFPTKEHFNKAKIAWDVINQTGDSDKIVAFISEYLTPLKLNWQINDNYRIGDQRGSAIKLLILFQEILFNAIKYTGLVPSDKRSIKILAQQIGKDSKLKFQIENAFDPEASIKTSGLGHIIISNFSKLLQTEPVIKKTGDKFTLCLTIPNLWR